MVKVVELYVYINGKLMPFHITICAFKNFIPTHVLNDIKNMLIHQYGRYFGRNNFYYLQFGQYWNPNTQKSILVDAMHVDNHKKLTLDQIITQMFNSICLKYKKYIDTSRYFNGYCKPHAETNMFQPGDNAKVNFAIGTH